MASAKPFPQHRVSTVFLRVPSAHWSSVIGGRQSEFRAALGNVPQLFGVPLPTLAVAYRKRKAAGDYDHRLMVLEDVRMEMLGAITEEGLKLAGYQQPRDEAYARFRRDWMIRERKKFTPTRKVMVFRVSTFDEQSLVETGLSIVNHLYQEYLDAPTQQAREAPAIARAAVA